MLARPPRLAVHGRAQLVEELVVALRAAPCRVARIERLTGAALRRVDRLLLADPVDARQTLAELAELSARVRPAGAPLPVLLIEEAARPLDTTAVDAARLRLERFDIGQRAARALLRRWPPHWSADVAFGQPVHCLIAGTAPPAMALWRQVPRLAHYGEKRLTITLVDTDPDALRARFAACCPGVEQFARVAARSFDQLPDAADPPVSLAIVCGATAALGLDWSRRLARGLARARGALPPLLVEIGRAPARGTLADWDGQRLGFAYRDLALCPRELLGDDSDALARIVHEHYRDMTAAQGRDPSADAAGQPWPLLDETYRDANRHQADHLWAKLALTDCLAVPEERVEAFAFTPAEVERLALVEHQRWAADRLLNGWTYAPARDNARKRHPQLVPYAALDEPMKDLDRFAVRLIPRLLARAGQGVLRRLIVALADAEFERFDGARSARFARWTRAVLDRLESRYPRRALTLASTLANAPARRFVRDAIEQHGADLIWLCPRPPPAPLAGTAARAELLALGALASRRVALDGGAELERWIAARADILARGARPGSDWPRPTKQVGYDPVAGARWNFEY